MNVIKRDGTAVPLNLDKVHKMVELACDGLTGVSESQVEMNANLQFFDGIKTSEIQDILIRSASDLIDLDAPNYQYVAGRLINYHLRKQVYGTFTPPCLCDIIHHTCITFGFMPNYKKGKSSVVLELRGKGAPDVKHAVYIDNDMQILFSNGELAIRVVPSYQHLGSHQPNIATEIKHRSREHAAVIGPLKKAVFSNKNLDMQTKRVYANALADTKLWFNAATWPRLSEQQYASLDACIMKRIAPMTGMQWTAKDHRASFATICAKA